MKLLTLLSISSLFFLLSSCDCEYDYTYEVKNKSSSTIKVKWETVDFISSDLIDSVEIAPGNTQILFMTAHGIEPCRTGPFYQEIDGDLVSFTITKDDSVVTKLDYMDDTPWLYEDGLYKAVIADSAF